MRAVKCRRDFSKKPGHRCWIINGVCWLSRASETRALSEQREDSGLTAGGFLRHLLQNTTADYSSQWWWSFRRSKSIWSRSFKQKYFGNVFEQPCKKVYIIVSNQLNYKVVNYFKMGSYIMMYLKGFLYCLIVFKWKTHSSFNKSHLNIKLKSRKSTI